MRGFVLKFSEGYEGSRGKLGCIRRNVRSGLVGGLQVDFGFTGVDKWKILVIVASWCVLDFKTVEVEKLTLLGNANNILGEFLVVVCGTSKKSRDAAAKLLLTKPRIL